MNRWKAAATHLSISFFLAAAVTALLYFLWFPSPYFVAAAANKLILLLIIVDVCVGPLLTLIVVNRAKPRNLIKLDLTVIGCLQVAAFAYGIHVIAAARPVFVIAAIDRIVIVSSEEIDDADLLQAHYPQFRTRSWHGPILAGISRPVGEEAIHMTDQAMSGGKDLEQLPKFYVPYAQVAKQLMRRAKPLNQLKHATSRQISELQRRFGNRIPLTLPLQRGDHDYTVIISSQTGRPLLIVPINPW